MRPKKSYTDTTFEELNSEAQTKTERVVPAVNTPPGETITLVRTDWEDVISLMIHGVRNSGPENFEAGGRLWRLLTLQLGKGES